MIEDEYIFRKGTQSYEGGQKRYKIKMKRELENEIDSERKNVTINALVTGVAALGAITCFSLTGVNDAEFSQRVGTLLLGVASSKGVYDSVKVLTESLKRKAKLENSYFDTFGIEYEEKRGRAL